MFAARQRRHKFRLGDRGRARRAVRSNGEADPMSSANPAGSIRDFSNPGNRHDERRSDTPCASKAEVSVEIDCGNLAFALSSEPDCCRARAGAAAGSRVFEAPVAEPTRKGRPSLQLGAAHLTK